MTINKDNKSVIGYRDYRIQKIKDDDGVIPLKIHPKIVFHYLPQNPFLKEEKQIDVKNLKGIPPLDPLDFKNTCKNDGFLSHYENDYSPVNSYIHFFKTGRIEAVIYPFWFPDSDKKKYLNIFDLKYFLIKLNKKVNFKFIELQIPLPIIFHATLINASNLHLYNKSNSEKTFNCDEIHLHEIVYEKYDLTDEAKLKPLLNSICIACGFEKFNE